jgi:hypothetical protein
MKISYLGLLGFSLVCVILIAVTGNYIFAYPADFFFLAAVIAHRRQSRLDKQVKDFKE